MQFILNRDYDLIPMEKWFSIGHFKETFENKEVKNRALVVVIAKPIKDYEDIEDVDDEEYYDLDKDHYEKFEYEDEEYNNPVRRNLKMIAWFYYKHFVFRHITDILNKLKMHSILLESTGLNLTPLIAESEKLRDEYLAKHLDLIERNKDNFKITTYIFDEVNGDCQEDKIELISDVDFNEETKLIIVNAYDDYSVLELTDLKDNLKSLPDHLYKPLYKEYYNTMGILKLLKEDIIGPFFYKNPIIKDTKLQEYKELFNLYYSNLASLRVKPVYKFEPL